MIEYKCLVFQLPVRPDEVHSSGWKLVFNNNQCTVPEITTILQVVNVSNYDHVEQFISSFAMSKVAANKKLPNKSVNRLPYGQFTVRLQNNSSAQDICLYRGLTAYRVIL